MSPNIEDAQQPCSATVSFEAPVLKKARDRKFRVLSVLNEDIYCEELGLEEYLVLNVSSPSCIGNALTFLPPMPANSSHLKRIKNGQILIQPSSFPLPDDFVSKLADKLGTNVNVTSAMVPKVKPFTRRQFNWAKQRWPTSFHPNKEVEAHLNGTFFSEAEHQKIVEFFLEAEKEGNGGPGCVIVDVNGKIVAKSGERLVTLGHAVMCAVSDLCESHRIGESDVLQYLGTGFDVFLTREPCAMCAMALVHFRVGRVFFGERKVQGGALVSSWRIQDEKRLNHQYKVFNVEEIL